MSAPSPWREVWRFPSGELVHDPVASERPLELVIDGEPLAVLLRSPTGLSDDLALAVGFLVSEGVIASPADLVRLEPCLDPRSEGNRLHASLAPGLVVPSSARRVFSSTAACGLCGKSSIAALAQPLGVRPFATLTAADVIALAGLVAQHQEAFARSGSVHAAALFSGQTLAYCNEDVGRHNAVDKVVGHALNAGRALSELTLWVSGRVSFEIAQKALVAGLAAVVAVGGPTDLAVDLATRHGLTLVGFCRGGRFNVYAGHVAQLL